MGNNGDADCVMTTALLLAAVSVGWPRDHADDGSAAYGGAWSRNRPELLKVASWHDKQVRDKEARGHTVRVGEQAAQSTTAVRRAEQVTNRRRTPA